MYRAMCLSVCLAAVALMPADVRGDNVNGSYGWEDGVGTILGKFNEITASNAGAPDPVQAGSRSLKLVRGAGTTPQAYVAWIKGLVDGDEVTVSFWRYDDTAQNGTSSTPPSCRIWGHWNDNPNDVMGFNTSAGGNEDYGLGLGWDQVQHTWTVSGGHTGLVVEARLYSNDGDTVWVDDIAVTVTAPGANVPVITLPGDVLSAQGLEVVTDVTAGQVAITLPSGDPGQANYQIVQGVTAVYPTSFASGSLTDPVTTLPVGAGQALASNEVVYNTGAAGLYEFTYSYTQAGIPSTEGVIRLWVQDVERVVITEIMYAPANKNDGEPQFDSDWEWVEITNLTESDIFLGTLWDNVRTTTDNIYFFSLPAGSTQVIVKPDRSLFSVAAFETEWNIVGQNATIQMLQAADVGEPRLENAADVLRLFDSDGALLDVVEYKNGSGWPVSNGAGSIYLEYGKVSTLDNDDAANWKLSADSVCEAWTTPGGDIGSPGVLPTEICNAPPVADDDELNVDQDTSPGVIITLVATDPESDPLTYSIVTGPAMGTLTDPNAGEADVTGGGPLAADEVRYTPAVGDTGDYTFTFVANDGNNDSNTATVTVHVLPVIAPPGVLAKWTFETSLPATAGPHAAEEGSGDATGLHVLGGTVYSNPVGNGSGESFSSNFWSTGDYYQFETSSVGYTGVEITFDQTRSGTGPGTFDVDISTDGVNWTTLVDDYVIGAVSWSSATYQAASTFGPFAAPALDDQATVYVRLVSQETTATGGTNRVDNVTLTGVSGVEPGEPPVLTAAESVKTHGVEGDFSVDVAAAGAVEGRANGPTSLVVTFDRDIQLVGGANDVTLSSGTVSLLSVNGDALTVTLAGVTNAAPLTVGFPGVADATDDSAVSTSTLCFGALIGDVNGDKATNVLDLVNIRNVLNQTATGANFRADVTADGTVNVLDLVIVRNNLNTSVAACP